jgi:Xaa-Pro dipeptidase
MIGAVGGKECVKIEQQVLVTEGGYELLSHAPLGLRPDY